jgi:hypothetical protein
MDRSHPQGQAGRSGLSRAQIGKLPFSRACSRSDRLRAKSMHSVIVRRGIRPLLFNLDEALMQDKNAERFKVEPTRLDRQLFRNLLNKPLAELQQIYAPYFTKAGSLRKTGGAPPKPLVAWWYVRQRAAEFIDAASSQQGLRLRAVLEAMLQDMHVIVITLADTDDAQVIFETLNFGGEPLAAMDLVRNDVFHRAARKNENIEDLMDTGWAMFETPFWKERATQGRITKPRMDFFLAHALAAETGKETLLNELYAAYKPYAIDRKYPTIEAELQSLRKYAPTYRALVLSEPGQIGRLAFMLDIFDMSTAYPLVLAVNATTADAEIRETVNFCPIWTDQFTAAARPPGNPLADPIK